MPKSNKNTSQTGSSPGGSSAWLKKMGKAWGEAEENQKQLSVVIPTGIYTTQLQSIALYDTKTGGLRVGRENVIQGGEFDGIVGYDNTNLTNKDGTFNEWGLGRLRAEIANYGYEVPSDPKKLHEVLLEITEEAPVTKIQYTRDGDFLRCKLLEVLDSDNDDSEDSDDDPQFDEMSRKELKVFIKSEGLDVEVKKSMSDEEIRQAIAEQYEADEEVEDEEEEVENEEDEADEESDEEDEDGDEEDEGDEGDDEEEEEEDEETEDKDGEDEYTEEEIRKLRASDLEALVKTNELEIDIKNLKKESKGNNKKYLTSLRDAIVTHMGDDEEEEDEDEEETGSSLLLQAQAFCASMDIRPKKGSIKDLTDIERIKDLIRPYKYPENTLSGEELEMMIELELDEECVGDAEVEQKTKTTKKKGKRK